MPASSAQPPHTGDSSQGVTRSQASPADRDTMGAPPDKPKLQSQKAKPPNAYHHLDPPRPLANAQQILRARYKDRNIPARTWKQEEARKLRENEIPNKRVELVSAARKAQENARAYVSEQQAHIPGETPSPRGLNTTRQIPRARPVGRSSTTPINSSSSNFAAKNSYSTANPLTTNSSAVNSSTANPNSTNTSASVSPRHSLSNADVPFPAVDSSRELVGNTTPERPSMRRNSSLLSLAAAKAAQSSPSVRRDSGTRSRQGSVAPPEFKGLSARSHSSSMGSLSAAAGTSPRATAGAKASDGVPRTRSREQSISANMTNSVRGSGSSNSSSGSISRSGAVRQTGRPTSTVEDNNPNKVAMFGGIPAPQNRTANAAARASSSKPVSIAPRAPMSSRFVKSLSAALKREQDDIYNAAHDNDEKMASMQELQNRAGPSISNKATENVTRRLDHAPGTPITPTESNRVVHSIGSQRGANSAFTANISPKVSNTDKELARQKAEQERRANAQLAANMANNRIEENLSHLNTKINMAQYLDSSRSSRRELMKKYRPAASWSAPARAFRPQLKRLTTTDTIESVSGDQGGSAITPKATPPPSHYAPQLLGDAYKYKASSNLMLSNNSSSSSVGGASIGGASVDSKRLAPLLTNFGSGNGNESQPVTTPVGPLTDSTHVGGPLVAGAPLFTQAPSSGPVDPLSPMLSSPGSPGRIYNRPARMATTLRRSNRVPRPVSRSETAPEFDHRTTNGNFPLPGHVHEPVRSKTALGCGTGNLYGGLESPPGLVESNSVTSSVNSLPQTLSSHNNPNGKSPPLPGSSTFSASSSNAYKPPPQTQPRMLSTLRNSKFDRRQFDSEKPWKGHRELEAISERERKRYESLWAANRDRHLPFIFVPSQYQEAWFEALQQVLPALKPLIDSERDNFSETASTSTVATTSNALRPPSVRSSRSFMSMRSVSSNLFDHHQDSAHNPMSGGTSAGSHAFGAGLKNNNKMAHQRTFSGSSGIYVPFGPSQPPPSLLSQSQQHQQQTRMARLQLNHQNESASSFNSIGGAPTSPSRSNVATSQGSLEHNTDPLSPTYSTSSQDISGFGSESPRIITSKHHDDTTESASHSSHEPFKDTESVDGGFEESGLDGEASSTEIDMTKEVEGRINDVHGYIVARIWRRSHLPEETLSKIWELVDHNHDGTLDSSGFIVGMWLCDQCLYGRKLPPKVPVEVWQSVAPLNLKIRFKEKKTKISHVKKLPNYFGSAVGFTLHGGRQAVKRAVQTATK